MICNENDRIAIFISSMEGGGAQRSMLNLARGLARRGFRIDLLLARADGPYMSDIPDSVRLIDLKCKRVLKSVVPLVRYLRSEQPTAMLSALGHVNLVALWARRLAGVSTRLIISERNQFSHRSKHSAKRIDRFLVPWLAKRFYPWADRVVAVSNGVADDLAFQIPILRPRICTIYNPVARPKLFEMARQTVDHPWFQSTSPPVVVAAGHLHAQKDFSTLIRAIGGVQKNQPVRLLILGEGPERSALERMIEERGLQDVVSLPGFTQNPYAFMSRAALFVLSSRYEGLPGVLIEAMCCGAPVIATDCPSGPREILQDGKYGSLVPVGDAEAMAESIQSALKNRQVPPRESVRRFEPETIEDQFLSVLTGKD